MKLGGFGKMNMGKYRSLADLYDSNERSFEILCESRACEHCDVAFLELPLAHQMRLTWARPQYCTTNKKYRPSRTKSRHHLFLFCPRLFRDVLPPCSLQMLYYEVCSVGRAQQLYMITWRHTFMRAQLGQQIINTKLHVPKITVTYEQQQ